MHDLTAYFLTTDRLHAEESLASLRAQGLPNQVRVVRNVRPLHRALLATLECTTPYCVILDDDIILEPGVIAELLVEFQCLRESSPNMFRLSARIYSEAKRRFGKGGLKMFHTASLKKVGWHDEPHVAYAQQQAADRLGLTSAKCPIDAGVQKAGSDLDLYKKFLWMALRAQAGQLRTESLDKLKKRARVNDERHWWIACLGTADAIDLGAVAGSKHEDLRGARVASTDLDDLSTEQIKRLIAAHQPTRTVNK